MFALLWAFLVVPVVGTPSPALADTAPPDSTLPTTVTSEALPTAQINGVVWTQVVAGDTVYVGGEFTKARPAGAALGSQESDRHNIMAYNIKTGVMTSFAHDVNAVIYSLVLSSDGTTLYAGGAFTAVDGITRNRVAAFNTATGALTSFDPNVPNGTVIGLATTPTLLYLAGNFSLVAGVTRTGVAAVTRDTAIAVPGFAPTPAGGTARQIVVSPDLTKVVVGGSFTSMNGSNRPGYGLALLNAADGSLRPMPVNNVVRDGDVSSAILSLVGTPNAFYGSGYVYNGQQGTLEGSFKSDWDGNLIWLEDCHGDTYSVFPSGQELYVAGHPHHCGNIGGFYETTPRTTRRALAFSDSVRGTISKDLYGYTNFEGNPRPDLLVWMPDINAGTYTGQSQGPWSVSGTADYVVYGGEFTLVNNAPQQGLVRFARPNVAGNPSVPRSPNSDGPRLGGANLVPTARSFGPGLRLSWPADYDRDNEQLSYDLIKNGNLSTPVFHTTALSTWWRRPNLAYLDTAVTPGQSYTYRIRATDPKGNKAYGDTITATASGGVPLSSYDKAALADGPQNYWAYDETSGSTAADLVGSDPATLGSGVTKGVPGAITGDPNTAFRFSGTSTGTAAPQTTRPGPQIFSIETWFKTTSTGGGKLIGYGNRTSGGSTSYDRHLYLSKDGRIYFGTYPGAGKLISTSSAGYNDGQWHHVVGTLSPKGLFLYLDGSLATSNTTGAFSAQLLAGVWRVGGDTIGSWAGGAGTTGYFAGDIDDPAVYPVALTAPQVSAHYAARNGPPPNAPPTAAFGSTITGLTAATDGSASSDADGTVTAYAWTFGDGGTASGATASHTYTASGTYPVTLTVTDDDGATGTVSHNVTVAGSANDPFAADDFNRTVATGWGNADVGGAWTVSNPGIFSVGSGNGSIKLNSAGAQGSASLGAVPRSSTDLTLNLAADKAAVGGTTYLYVEGRRVDAKTEYRSAVKLTTTNRVSLGLEALKGTSTAAAIGTTVVLPETVPAGTPLHVRMQVFGTSPTTVRAKLWTGANAEPTDWMVSGTDAYGGLQVPGAVGLIAYLSGSASNAPVTVSVPDLSARPVN